VFYNATRKLVLKGADAIVFVADSEVGKMEENKESLGNLRANLAEYSLNLDDLPWVIQYNKRDIANAYTIEELNAELNPGGKIPFFEAVATQGKGVFETFRGISHLLMEKVTKDLRRTPMSGASTAPANPVKDLPKVEQGRAEATRPSVLNTAPGRAIAREAQQTASASPLTQPGDLDYGREISLPDEIPPRTARPAPAPAAAAPPAPAVAARKPMPTPLAPSEAPAPRREVAPRAASPQRQDDSNGRSEESSSGVMVVPVKIPRGGSREIVLRIVISSEDE
jgi:hypothetical protein